MWDSWGYPITENVMNDNDNDNEDLEARLRAVEQALKHLQDDTGDNDDEEVRLQSELSNDELPDTIQHAVHALYLQLQALQPILIIVDDLVEELPSGVMYTDLVVATQEVAYHVQEAKRGLGVYIDSSDLYSFSVDETDQDSSSFYDDD